MTVNSYLTNLSSKLVLKNLEKEKIELSISTLESRLNHYFSNIKIQSIENKFMFGSYTRNTILPRKADENSDIDYMVVFENPNKYKPDTLLNWLKDFVNYYYSRSEIYRSHPTIVLELNHIKFELVPAFNSNNCYGSLLPNYKIPAPASNYLDWMDTNPTKLKTDLTNKNVINNSLIKPAVRLLKYWNVLNNKIYSSYQLEELAINQYYINSNSLTDILNTMVQALPIYSLSQINTTKVSNLKIKMNEIKNDMLEYPLMSEKNIKEIFPDIII